MTKMNRIIATALAILMALSVMAVSAFAEEISTETSGGRMPVGSTPYSIEVPEGYYDEGPSEVDMANGIVSVYTENHTEMSFDIYELEKAASLEEFVTAECAANAGTDLNLNEIINGIPMTSYRSSGVDSEKGVYYAKTYAFEYGDKIVEVDFYWVGGPEIVTKAEQIMSTFKMSGVQQIAVGLSGYSIMIPKEFAESEVGEEDWEAGMIRAFANEYSGLEIETYWFANEAGASLEEVAAAQCEAYNGTMLPETEINGIPMAEYVAHQTYDGEDYYVYVVLVQSEDGSISAAAFYLNNYCAYIQAEAYMHTLGWWDAAKNIALEPTVLQLGSSGYRIDLPCGFATGVYPQEEFEEDGLLAAYTSPYSDISIDLYQCVKATQDSDELAAFTEIDAAKYSGTEIDLTNEINGIPVTVYRSVETYDDITYDCLTYTFEAQGIYFVQLCFYWIGEDMSADVEAIMNTLAPVAMQDVQVAKSAYTMSVARDTAMQVIIDEESGYDATFLTSESGAPSVTVINCENYAGLSFEEYVTEEAKRYGANDLSFGENANGVNLGGYTLDYTVPDSGEMFGVLINYVEANGEIFEIDIVIDSYAQYMMAMDALASIKAA